MKKIITLLAIAVIAVGTLAMTSCAKSEFALIGESEDSVTVTAKNAKKGSTSLVSGLEVAEGGQIVMTSDLERGTVRIELFKGPDEQSIDELPEPEGDAFMTFDASGADSESATVEEGNYFVQATVTEKATGTVRIISVKTEK